jgi:hypothetical protein
MTEIAKRCLCALFVIAVWPVVLVFLGAVLVAASLLMPVWAFVKYEHVWNDLTGKWTKPP